MVDLKEYSKFNDSVDMYDDSIKPVIYILGLIGELGEFCNKYKKIFRDHGGILPREKQLDLILELGDMGWYFERLCKANKTNLEEVIEKNWEKLNSRKLRNKIGGAGDHR